MGPLRRGRAIGWHRRAPSRGPSVSRDGQYALRYEGSAAEVANGRTGAGISKLGPAGRPNAAVFSDDGSRVLTIGGDVRTTASTGPSAVWLTESGELVRRLGTDPQTFTGAFDGDATPPRVATGGEDGVVRLWALEDPAAPPTVVGTAVGRVVALAMSRDGRFVAVASRDTTARVWEPDRAAAPILLTGRRDDVFGIDFSPDGALVVTTGADRTARVWDGPTGEELLAVPADVGGELPAAPRPTARE